MNAVLLPARLQGPLGGSWWLLALTLVMMVLVFLALIWKIAVEIGRDNSFCYDNAKRLRMCSNLALADVILYLIAGCVLGAMNMLHFALIVAGVVICSIGAAIAVCCAALSHLTRKAADMQAENDLTV